MSLEKIQTIAGIEENKSFEELGFTRDFGEVSEIDAKELVKKNFNYWKTPTIADFSALKKQSKFKFFKNKYYWAKDFTDRDISGELKVVKIGLLDVSWHFASEVDEPKHLVMLKNGTNIEGTEEEKRKLSENYPF